MKFNLLAISIFISLNLSAQQDMKIVKLDNSKYPDIELLVKSTGKLDTGKLKIFENKKELNYLISDVPVKELKKERRFLFLINDFETENIKSVLNEEISEMEKTDKMNIGIMKRNKDGKENIIYASPEFSGNFQFFRNYLDQFQPDINFSDNINCKDELIIQSFLFSQDSELKNTGIIILGNLEKNDLNFCSDIHNASPAPVYILQTVPLKKKKEDKLIALCMNSGGMYTQSKSKKDAFRILKRYNEDISLYTYNSKSNLKKVVFQASENSNETNINIVYEKYNRQFKIVKPEKNVLSKKELYLTVFSSILFLMVIILLIFNNKNKKRSRKKPADQQINIPLPIEINIKGKGMNKTFYFEKHLIRIGRNPDNDIIIPDTTVSGNHAIINKQSSDFFIQDLESTNGVVINNKKIKKQQLKTGEKIKLGAVVLFVRITDSQT